GRLDPPCSNDGPGLVITHRAKARHDHLTNAAACRERPRRRAAEQRDELTPPHSITSSARTSSAVGTVSPSALGVVRLMVRSNLVGFSTGMSAGLAPRRTLSINSALRRKYPGSLFRRTLDRLLRRSPANCKPSAIARRAPRC